MSIAGEVRRRAAWGLGTVAMVWLAGIPFGNSAAVAQGYGRQFYVPGGAPPNAFYSSGGRYFIVEPPRRSRGDADPHKKRANDALRKALPPPPVKGPLLIAISISSQKLTVYDDGVPIATSPVSTGTASHPTPTGVFSVIGKERFHRSNLYSAAPMPFMQRITWSGVALHAGVLPGYPASHGCIRLPHDFAIRLYHTTKMGARVVISQHDLTPVEIAHANLFAPKPKPAAPPPDPVVAATPTPTPVIATVMPAPEEKPALAVAEKPAPAVITTVMPAPGAAAGAAHTSAAANGEAAAASQSASPTAAAQTPTAVAADATPAPASTPAIADVGSDAAVNATKVSTAAPADAKPAVVDPPPVKPVDAIVKVEPAVVVTPPAPPSSGVIMAGLRPTVASPRIIPERAVRPGPVSVFISRKERRLYVRKGFEPLFEMPVEITNPDQTIGTHVFTAMALGEDNARWSVVTMPPERPRTKRVAEAPARAGKHKSHARTVEMAVAETRPAAVTAAEALDRIVLPKDAVDRITPMLSVGASLVISDQGLGSETGLETDFVVVTREYAAMPVEKRQAPRQRPRRQFF